MAYSFEDLAKLAVCFSFKEYLKVSDKDQVMCFRYLEVQ